MIEYKKGDLLKAGAEALVNTVNCVGVMGRGIALQFKNAFPDNFRAYAEACAKKTIILGKIFVFQTDALLPPRYIVNFPTKNHWRAKSRLEDIKNGLDDLCDWALALGLKSIALPPLGCGLGGLPWPDVKDLMTNSLARLDQTHIIIFEPSGAPAPARMIHRGERPELTPARAALLWLMENYTRALLDPFVSLLEIHKLMYFLQAGGENLKLRFKKAPHGPYAENLRHLLNRMEGFYISGYGDGGDEPGKPVELLPGATASAETMLAAQPVIKRKLNRVLELVEGYESGYGLELLASVHWLATQENPLSGTDLINKFYSWNPGKKKFSQRQIEKAIECLRQKGWLQDVAEYAARG